MVSKCGDLVICYAHCIISTSLAHFSVRVSDEKFRCILDVLPQFVFRLEWDRKAGRVHCAGVTFV